MVIAVAAVYTGGVAANAFWGSSTAAGLAVTTGSATVMTTTAGVIGGATGGFTAGLLGSGGEIKPAVRGGLGGGLTGGVGGSFGDAWNWQRVAANSVAGGVSSELSGGTFADGFKMNFVTSSARLSYNKIMEYDATWRPGGGLAGSKGIYDETLGIPNGPIVFGTNTSPLTGGFFADFFKQGGALSLTANYIPGMNSLAKLHDFFQIGFDSLAGSRDSWLRAIGNVPAMVPAVAINYAALLHDAPVNLVIDSADRIR